MRPRYGIPLLVLVLLAAPLGSVRADSDDLIGIGDLPPGERVLHVLNRMAYGPRPGEVDRIERSGLCRWIVDQLHPGNLADDDCDHRLAELTEFRKSATELARELTRQTPEERKQYAADLRELADLRRKPDAPRERLRELTSRIQEYRRKNDRYRALSELAAARVIRAVYSKRQLKEVMVDFWFNHFNIFARKGAESLLIPEFEESVIRPRVLGKFEDLLVAVAKSPAMLYYLDNFQSVAPPGAKVLARNGRVVARPGRAGDRGINENYARELMELHTVGVDHGYTQQDIIQVARCFTGWSITSPNGRGKERTVAFEFRPYLHDAGVKTVMGRTIPAGRGIEDGMEVLHMLATSPATARFLSEKLCRKFVADHPPESLVDRCVKTWLETDGDIRLVLYRIFTSPEFLSEAAARTKMKTPFEFAMSAIRATGAETAAPRALLRRIGDLGEPLYFCEPPTGFADVADRWSGSNAVLSRLNFATALAFGRLPGVRVDTRGLSGDAPKDPDGLADWLVRRLLGCPLSPGSEAALTRTIEQAHSEAEGRSRRLPRSDAIGALAAMILGSPDFQMQ